MEVGELPPAAPPPMRAARELPGLPLGRFTVDVLLGNEVGLSGFWADAKSDGCCCMEDESLLGLVGVAALKLGGAICLLGGGCAAEEFGLNVSVWNVAEELEGWPGRGPAGPPVGPAMGPAGACVGLGGGLGWTLWAGRFGLRDLSESSTFKVRDLEFITKHFIAHAATTHRVVVSLSLNYSSIRYILACFH